ncbi:DNA helicase [Colletotrichum truncatum]|uniref:DNA helicase n=1 Tax=Colletotrichum truncatum TaxID=5467 RepID=A0ACC3YWK9_COLTU
MMGSGFHEYMSGQGLTETLAATSLEMNEQIQVRQWRDLPVVNFLSGLDQDLVDSLCEEALPDDRVRFKAYLSEKLLGIGIITAGPGFGKTTAVAAAALAMRLSLGPTACSAPSHVAITNLAERLDRTSISVSQRINNRKASQDSSRARQTFILRVFKLENEYKAFLALLKKPGSGDKAAPKIRGTPVKWTFNLSLAYWLLVLLKSPATTRRLVSDDSLALQAIQRDLDVRQDFRYVRELCANRIDYDEFSSCSQPSKDAVLKVFHRLIDAADMLCTTPSMFCNEARVAKWNAGKARAVAFDEAANMTRGDIIQVWGNDLLPCLFGGDPKQLPPAVMTREEKTAEGHVYNQLSRDATVSGLEFLQASGIPVYRLRKQLRMTKALWDMVGGIIYSDQPIVYGDQCDIHLPQYEIGRRLESYIQSQYPDVRTPAENTFSPLFIHCEGTSVFTNPVTHGKKSDDQVTVALDFASDFVKEKAVDASKVIVLAPYKDNVQLIEQRRKQEKYANLAAMRPASSIDAFQGQEADIVIVVMGTRALNPGPGFTKDPRRLNVLLTRQRCGLVMIGDINVAGSMVKPKNAKGPKLKEGEYWVCIPGKPRVKMTAKELWKVHKYLHDRGRVATIKVNVKTPQKDKTQAGQSGLVAFVERS